MMLVETHPDVGSFRFGDGDVIKSDKLVVIPIRFGSQQLKLMTNVIDRDIPLLLSRESLKRASAEIDFKTDTVTVLGEKIDVSISKSGHLCIPLIHRSDKQYVKQILFSSPLQINDDKENSEIA